MRWRSLPRESRYSAFHQGNIDYLLATHQESQRQATNSAAFQKSRSTLAKSVSSNRWLNLLIINVQKGQAKDKTGVVEFVAAYRPVSPLVELTTVELASADQGDDLLTGHLNAEALQLHERSQFVKESDRWLYTEGDILAPYEPKRSEACWCGSGKKFKQCHSG
jgi:SEC-C motif domain protein